MANKLAIYIVICTVGIMLLVSCIALMAWLQALSVVNYMNISLPGAWKIFIFKYVYIGVFFDANSCGPAGP